MTPYQSDFLLLVNELRHNHLGLVDTPLPSFPMDVFEREVEDTARQLESIGSEADFFMIVSKFLAKLNDAHTYLSPGTGFEWGPTLPLDFAWVGDELYIVQSHVPELRHARVIALNDLPLAKFEQHVNQYLSRDRGNVPYLRRYPRGNTSLMVRREVFQDQESVDMVVETNGTTHTVCVPFETGIIQPLPDFCRNTITRFREGNHWQIVEDDTIYLQLNSLPVRYDSQLFDELFLTAHQKGLRHLILDLRNNRGGWAGWNDEFLRYVVKRRTALLVFKGWRRNGERNVPERDGYLVVEPIRRLPPFEGQIYALVGPVTWSSGTFFAVAIKDNELGLLVGQPCGSNCFRYGHTYSIPLPNALCTFISSSRIWERTLATYEEFITPHVNITYTIDDVREQKDPVFDWVMSHRA